MATLEPKEERRQVLIWAATNARSDVLAHALDEERKDPDGDVAELLAAQPVVPGEQQPKGTALHVACRAGHVDIVRLLLLRNAPLGVCDHQRKTPYEAAVEGAPTAKLAQVRGAFEAELFKRAAGGDVSGAEAIARALMAGGVDVSSCDQGGYTPVAWAELFGQTAAADQLRALAAGEGGGAAAAPHGAAAAAAAAAAEPPLAAPAGAPPATAAAPSGGGGSAAGLDPPARPAPGGPRRVRGLLLWPPPLGAACWGAADGFERRLGAAAGGPAAALPALAETTVAAMLPPEADSAVCVRLLEELEAALGEALRNAGVPGGGPVLSPSLASISGGARDLAAASVSCTLDPMLLATPGAMRLVVIPAPDGADAGGRVELVGHDAAGLQAAVDTLRQLLLHHARPDPAGGRLLLPALSLEDAPAADAPSALMDVWRLGREALRPALRRLRSWRFARLYVPLPVPDPAATPGCRAQLRRLALEVRAACVAEGVGLVPVVSLAAGEALLPPGVAENAAAREAFEAIAEALALFHGSRLVGLRLLPARGARGGEGQSPTEAALVLARLEEVQVLLHAAGLVGPAGASVTAWLPADDPRLLEEVCGAVRAGGTGLASRFAAVLDPSALDGPSVVAQAVAVTSAYGVPAQVFAAAPTCPVAEAEVADAPDGADAGEAAAALVGAPPFVAPRPGGAGALAASLARLCAEGRRAGAGGLVVEVPVYGAPWCGAGTCLPEAWCGLTACLAAGLARDPEGCAAALGVGDTAGCGELGELLAAQVLGAPGGSTEAAGAALALFGAGREPPAGAAASPPEAQLPVLLGVLSGRPALRSGGLEAAVAGANAWFQLLTERKRQLESSPAGVPAAVQPWLSAAQAGVEWLRFACRLLMLLAKHAPAYLRAEGGEPQGLDGLRAALRLLPPTKISDTRNSFLKLVERTTGLAGWWGEDDGGPVVTGPAQAGAAEALWRGGLRVGAALDLEPWTGLLAAQSGAGCAPGSGQLVVC